MKRFLIALLFFASCKPAVEYRNTEQTKLTKVFIDNRAKLGSEKDITARKEIVKKATHQIDSLLTMQELVFSNQIVIVEGVREAYGGITAKLRFDLYPEDISDNHGTVRAIVYVDDISNFNKKYDIYKKLIKGDTLIVSGKYVTNELNGISFYGGLEDDYPEFKVNITALNKK